MSGMPTVWIGLDSVDLQEVQRRMADGRMPHMAALSRLGRLRPLEPDVPGFCGGIWRSFVNGVPVGEHGWHFSKIWRPELGRLDQAGPDWLRLEPFWQQLTDAGLRVGLVDVPHAPDPGADFDGVYVSGWQTHDYHPRRTRPASLLGELEGHFGRPWLAAERYGPQAPGDLFRLHQQGLASIHQIAAIGEWLLRRQSFDLFMVVIGAAHRVGHYIWDLSQIDTGRLTADEAASLREAMDDVYGACDAAIGRIASAAPAGARIAAYALHGMGSNPGWTDLFPEMVRRLGSGAGVQRRRSLRDCIFQLRRSPMALRASRLLPAAAHRAIGRQWSSRMHDWSTTHIFSVPGELGGAIRVNLAGRESAGIVEPGPEYDRLCAQLVERLGKLESLGRDEPIVASVHLVDRLVPNSATFRDYLPDIVVEWDESRIGDSVGVRVADAGELRWGRGRRIPSGRSGNHRPRGWVLGDVELTARRLSGQQTVLDLVPGLFRSVGMLADRNAERMAVQARMQDALAKAS